MRHRQPRSLGRVRAIPDPHKRGYAFERFIADLFREAGFDVTPNAGAAAPRQTDLVARRGDQAYLIETKWEDRKTDVSGVSALHDRLIRTSSELVGVFFSYGGFSEEAKDDVRARRAVRMLLFDEEAIDEIGTRPRDLVRLLELKRTMLMDRAMVHTGGSGTARFIRSGLPSSNAAFVMRDGTRTSIYRDSGGYNNLVFAAELPDIDWTPTKGNGVTFDLNLDVFAVSDLVAALKDLLETQWTTKPEYVTDRAARWSIQQAEANWHGEGSREFIAALKSWKRRYEEIGDQRLHHTEEFAYVDKCRGGFFTLSGQVSADPRRILWHSVLSFQLEGLPLDDEYVRRIRTRFGGDVFIRSLNERSLEFCHVKEETQKISEPLARIVQSMDGEQWVVGLVIKNPYRGAVRNHSSDAAEALPWGLDETEVLVCDLAEWHLLERQKVRYYLRKIEWSTTSSISVVRPIATGKKRNDPVSRSNSHPRSEFRSQYRERVPSRSHQRLHNSVVVSVVEYERWSGLCENAPHQVTWCRSKSMSVTP
jgi:hypothetical protein